MKKLMLAAAMMSVFTVVAADDAKELEKQDAPIFWGFGNYGIYSGYQLYGSLVNDNPTLQGYVEANVNIPADIGYVGLGLWSNTDLTKRRADNNLGQAFNEWDPNIHFGRTFWFDDDKTWGLDWRSTFVWFYYPGENYNGSHDPNKTTWDFDHSFALINPYVIPFVTFVREYAHGANLIDFGLKRTFEVSDGLTVTPIVEFVWRETQYNWCFPTAFDGGYPISSPNSGIATGKLELDVNYQISDHFGLFAKVAYCCVCDPDLRDNCDVIDSMPYSWYSYGSKKDFAWGGVGITFNF